MDVGAEPCRRERQVTEIPLRPPGQRYRRLLASILFGLLTFVTRCSPEMRDDLGELSRLSALAKDLFKADDVNVSLVNNRVLVVSLVNCAAGGLSDSERKYAAHDVAFWTKSNYRQISMIQTISVVFVEHHFLLFYYVASSENFTFPVKDLDRIPAPGV